MQAPGKMARVANVTSFGAGSTVKLTTIVFTLLLASCSSKSTDEEAEAADASCDVKYAATVLAFDPENVGVPQLRIRYRHTGWQKEAIVVTNSGGLAWLTSVEGWQPNDKGECRGLASDYELAIDCLGWTARSSNSIVTIPPTSFSPPQFPHVFSVPAADTLEASCFGGDEQKPDIAGENGCGCFCGCEVSSLVIAMNRDRCMPEVCDVVCKANAVAGKATDRAIGEAQSGSCL